MALNATELGICADVIRRLGHLGRGARVLSLGYPDLLATAQQVDAIFGFTVSAELTPRSDSATIAAAHNKPVLRDSIFDSEQVFAKLGASLSVADAIAWTGREMLLDLNYPAPADWKGQFDFIIDPGSIEHCFNVAQAMRTVSEMVGLGGFVYHQNPLCFVNHGFYSFSPTFYVDYYRTNGFSVEQLTFWRRGTDEHGLAVALEPAPERDVMLDTGHAINSVLVRKEREQAITWPIQAIYRG